MSKPDMEGAIVCATPTLTVSPVSLTRRLLVRPVSLHTVNSTFSRQSTDRLYMLLYENKNCFETTETIPGHGTAAEPLSHLFAWADKD